MIKWELRNLVGSKKMVPRNGVQILKLLRIKILEIIPKFVCRA